MQKNTEIQPEPEEKPFDITELRYQRLLKQILEFSQKHLTQNMQCLQFMSHHGFKNSDLLEEFQLAFIDRTLTNRLPNGKEGVEIRALLKEIGLLTETGRVLFNAYLVTPLFDDKQNIVNLYGIRIHNHKGMPAEIYLNENTSGMINQKALISPSVIICKTLFDTLSFWCAGHRNVTWFQNPSSITEAHLQNFQEHNTEKVYIAYPNDEVEEKNAEIIAGMFSSRQIETLRLNFPEEISVHQYLRRVKSAEQELTILLQTAKSIAPLEKPRLETLSIKKTTNDDVEWFKKGDSYTFTLGPRIYITSGVDNNLASQSMKVKLKASHESTHYRDNAVDLYSNKIQKRLIRNISEKLELEPQIIEKDLDRIITTLEDIQTELIDKAASDKEIQKVQMSKSELEKAMSDLKEATLLENIVKDFKYIGLVGEDINSLIGYIAASSRKENKPLGVIIQSSSGAGKTTLMDAILSLMPEEDVIKFSAMTGQSLYYMGEKDLKHKILALVEEQGAEKVSYSLKLLQSEGKISIASTGKDPDTGKLRTFEYVVEGPVTIFIATTSIEIDEELKNRCIILTINESREQTKRIHELQRSMYTEEGFFLESNKELIIKKHQNMQRLLRPIRVKIPFVKFLTFVDSDHLTRRENQKYLTIIATIAWLYQYQREIQTGRNAQGHAYEFIEATIEDLRLAHGLAGEVLGMSLDDLPPQTRNVLQKIHEFVDKECQRQKIDRDDCRFNRRQLRQFISISNPQLGVHLERLIEMDYLIRYPARKGQLMVYELVYNGEGDTGEKFLPGLRDPDEVEKLFLKKGRK